MNEDFWRQLGEELNKLKSEKNKFDNDRKSWTKDVVERDKLLKVKIKTLKNVIKYFDPLNEVFVIDKENVQ